MLFSESLPFAMAGPNRWVGEADPAYAHPGGRFGGYTAAILLRAAMLEPEGEPAQRGEPLSLTVLFTEAVQDGPVEISTRLLRSGARLQFWRAELVQRDKVCAHAQITFGRRREALAFTDAVIPDALPPEHPSLVSSSPPTPFGQKLVALWESDAPLMLLQEGRLPDGPATSRFWSRHADGLAMDATLLACLADFSPPRLMYRRRGFIMSSTVSMNIYFHATPAEMDEVARNFVFHQTVARRCEGGYFDHEMRIWSRSGALLATSEQVAAFRE